MTSSENTTPMRMLIMAGGTGGHVIPALSLAKELSRRGVEIHWLGSPRGLENTLVPQAGYPLHTIEVSGLRRNGLAGWLKMPLHLSNAVLQAKKIIRELKPSLVIGMGGFASGPGGLAAKLSGVPIVIHEQNAVAGMTNKVLARMAARVYAAFPTAFPASVKAQVVGNPVREEISALGEHLRTRDDMMDRKLHLLVVGGSLGASALNRDVPAALRQLSKAQRPDVRHQSGRNKLRETEDAYQKANVIAACSEFITDMAQAYEWADLIVCRAGALTIAELAAAGKPSILVPLPTAVDDHQTLNAHDLTDYGAAVLAPQKDITRESFAEKLNDVLHPDVLAEMSIKAHQRARPGTMEKMSAGCLEIAREH